MTKSKAIASLSKKAALVAAFFVGGCATQQLTMVDDGPPVIANLNVQAHFDQAVKLHWRYDGMADPPIEPYRSILTELGLYHEFDKATYLSDMKGDGQRSGPIEIGPWAQWELGRFYMQRGDYVEALRAYHDLGERYAGRSMVIPVDGEKGGKEPAEAAGLVGEIEATLAVARMGHAKNVLDALEGRINLLQSKYGDNYSPKALSGLWRALALDQANLKTWCKATKNFIKHEKSRELQAETLLALGNGLLNLGKTDDAVEYFEWAAKDFGDTLGFKESEAGEWNVLPYGLYAAKRLEGMKKGDPQAKVLYERCKTEVKKLRNPAMSEDNFQQRLRLLKDFNDNDDFDREFNQPQALFSNLRN